MSKAGNEGIQVSGGTVNIGQAAVGRHARLVVVTPDQSAMLAEKGMADIDGRLRDLERALAAYAHQLPEADKARENASQVAEEMTKPKPNRAKVLTALREIADAVKSVSGIVTAVEALKAAVAVFL